MTQCAVRRLHVAADSAPAARRFVTTLEDALRCATLPGDDRRVVVVRRLALGRVAHDASTQRLGLLIEQRLARGAIAWADSGEPPDARADVVGFADPLEARVQLARRLVQDMPCDAWYWPLAVREYRREQAPREALRHIARTIAALPEARVGFPRWITQVVDAGGAATLAAAIDEPAARGLLREAGFAWPVETPAHALPMRRPEPSIGVEPVHAPASIDATATAFARPPPEVSARTFSTSPTPSRPAWLDAVLAQAHGLASPPPSNTAAPAAEDRGESARPARTTARTHAAAPAPTTAREDRSMTAIPVAPPPLPAIPVRDVTPPRTRVPATSFGIDGDGHPTCCGGLLFLLPVLARAGLVRGDSPEADRVAAQRVLLAALRRVRAPADDAARTLFADLPVLRPIDARDADARALRDLVAARRWLHRHARMGLVTLVRRPARLAFTATHVDMRFPLAGADVRLRRIGLDLDPGWVPWFGRVVAFQFIGRLP